MSGFVELIACRNATVEETCTALIDWFKRYGLVTQWVSDWGTHFKNKVIELLRKCYDSHHHFTTAYCPWSNGTVEVVNRLLLRCVRALLSELRLHATEWPSILPMAQTALNQMPADRLDGVAPVTALTALPASSPILIILHPRTAEVVGVTTVYEKQKQHVKDVQLALEAMHHELIECAKKRQEQARARRAKKPGVEMPKFAIGDFVLVAQVTARANKLAVHWRGPRCIVNAINDYIFEFQNISPPFEVSTHHAFRLRFYAESSRDVTEDLIEQAMHGDGGHVVSKFLRCRIGAETHVWEIEVEWVGLDPFEASWEPAEIMYEDVPDLVKRFVQSQSADSDAHAM